MAGNSIGTMFKVTTAGESHGPALCAIVDGCPPGLALAEGDLQADLERRRGGLSRHTSQRREADQVRILSGVFEGRTTGAPIALLIENHDARPGDYEALRHLLRPGHADYTYLMKFGHRDHRGGGRASARETVLRVAAGAIARKLLAERVGVRIQGWLAALGPLELAAVDLDAARDNPFSCAEPARLPELEAFVDELRRAGDSVGARVRVRASGVPVGLGEPVFGRLDADLAHALMGINAVRGVEVGAGFASVAQRGSAHRDAMSPEGFASNHAGGVLGGIATGQDLELSVAFKPTSSLRLPVATVDDQGRAAEVVTHGRHDPCVGLRGVPVCEAMVAIVLLDHWLRHRAQCGDVAPPFAPLPPSAR
jgi:chorismate synthase